MLRSKNGNEYMKWKISDLTRCHPDFVQAANTKNPALISKLNPSLQEIIKTSTRMTFSPEGYKVVEVCFFGKVA